MYSNFTEGARKILMSAKEEMKNLKHPYVGSEHLLLSILKNKNNVSDKLKDYNLDYNKFKKELINIIGIGNIESNCFLYTPLLKRVMENAIYDSKENNDGEVTISHLFSSLLEEGEGVAIRILLSMDIDLDELYNEFAYKISKNNNKNNKLLVEELGTNLTKKAFNNELDPVYGREKEIKMIIEILCRRKKNNPILIGEAGVGKTAIVEELSRMIVNNEVPNKLKNKKIISLDMSSAVAGTKYRGEFEERINKIIKEIEEDDDIILFIDEIHTLVGAGGAEGAIDASNIFKPALARNKMRCIGATTTNEYKKYITNDKALDRRFQKIEVKIPTKEMVKEILLNLKDTYSKYHKTQITDEIIDYIIKLSNKYIKNRNEPDASIDILDEVCAHVSLKENKDLKLYNNLNKELNNIINLKKKSLINNDYEQASYYKEIENNLTTKINTLELKLSKLNKHKITKKDVREVISRKCNIELNKKINKKELIELENKLNKEIIGQTNVVNELIKSYKKLKLGIKEDNSCYSIMLVGPTGVGKSKLATLFSNNISNNVLKLDMSEYIDPNSINKLIGTPSGYVGYLDNKNILEYVKDNPNTILIIDNIELAHDNIINLFYQILDEGKIKDSKMEDIYFNNTIIIFTTNSGCDKKDIGFNSKNKKYKLDMFSKSFINRLDNIIEFNNIDLEDIKIIINKKLNILKEKYKEKNINIKINNNIKKEILDKCNYKEYGVRKIDKIIKNDIESEIINELLNGKDIIEIKSIIVENQTHV